MCLELACLSALWIIVCLFTWKIYYHLDFSVSFVEYMTIQIVHHSYNKLASQKNVSLQSIRTHCLVLTCHDRSVEETSVICYKCTACSKIKEVTERNIYRNSFEIKEWLSYNFYILKYLLPFTMLPFTELPWGTYSAMLQT